MYLFCFIWTDVPAPPEEVKLTQLSPTSIELTWSVPFSDGGSPIIGYNVNQKDAFSPRWNQITSEPIQELSYKVKSLKEGAEPSFHITAVNKAGPSKPSQTVALKIQPPGAPDAPLVEKIDDKAAFVTWSPPESTGGSPIMGYILEKRDTAKDRWVKVTRGTIKETSFDVKDLTKDVEYEFRVSAENKAGIGEPSQPSKRAVAKLPYGESINLFCFIMALKVTGPLFPIQ